MIVKILGPGCPNCTTLYKRTEQALLELGKNAEFIKIKDFAEISTYDILKTPGLVVDEKVIVSGRVPTVDEIKELVKDL